jgi:adenine phosphoribosyltransferase
MLANRLHAGFVSLHKPSKLPSKRLSETYDLEYGTDTFQIHIDAIEKAIGCLYIMMY